MRKQWGKYSHLFLDQIPIKFLIGASDVHERKRSSFGEESQNNFPNHFRFIVLRPSERPSCRGYGGLGLGVGIGDETNQPNTSHPVKKFGVAFINLFARPIWKHFKTTEQKFLQILSRNDYNNNMEGGDDEGEEEGYGKPSLGVGTYCSGGVTLKWSFTPNAKGHSTRSMVSASGRLR